MTLKDELLDFFEKNKDIEYKKVIEHKKNSLIAYLKNLDINVPDDSIKPVLFEKYNDTEYNDTDKYFIIFSVDGIPMHMGNITAFCHYHCDKCDIDNADIFESKFELAEIISGKTHKCCSCIEEREIPNIKINSMENI